MVNPEFQLWLMSRMLLGGPKFVGRAVIDAALERGHEVTLFNRGTTGADLYPELTRGSGGIGRVVCGRLADHGKGRCLLGRPTGRLSKSTE